MKLVECVDLHKSYKDDSDKILSSQDDALITKVLKGVNFSLGQGEQVAILGQSGSGKSTLLHLLGMLDDATSGTVKILGKDTKDFNELERAEFRNQNMGFIYQFHHLLMEFSALENTAMPLMIAGKKASEANKKAKELLELVGLGHRLSHLPSQLSGGERQRVAIARALINKPKLVLADEPTGNLDKENAQHVFDLFVKLNREIGTSLLVVTHDVQLAQQFDRVIKLDDGLVVQ